MKGVLLQKPKQCRMYIILTVNELRVKIIYTYLNLLSFLICVSKFKGLNIRDGESMH